MANAWGFPDWDDALGGTGGDALGGLKDGGGLSEREAHNAHKTEEEIDQYSVAEDLNDADLCAHLLRSGLPIQKLSALRRLPTFFADMPKPSTSASATTTSRVVNKQQAALIALQSSRAGPTPDRLAAGTGADDDLLPLHPAYTDEDLRTEVALSPQDLLRREADRQKLLQLVMTLLPRESSSFREAATRSLHHILVHSQLDETTVDKILQMARKCMHIVDAGADLRDAWLNIVEDTIPLASLKVLESDILPEVMVNGGHAQPAKLRQASCRLIGPLAGRLVEKNGSQKLYEKAISLCQDTDHEVRLLMCAQLYQIARTLPQTEEQSGLLHDILDEFVELLSDDAPTVREAAVTNYIHMLAILPDVEKQKYCVAGIRKMGVERHPAIARMILHRFGEIFFHLHEDATHRLECAYNLPAVVYCQGVKHFIASNMAETIKLLSEDSDELVRQKVALGFHEVCQTLGETSLNMLQETMTHLLEDASTKVSLAMYSKLAPILHIWSQRGRVDTEMYIDMLLSKEQEHVLSQSLQWRHHHDLLLQLSPALHFCDHDVLFDKVIPILHKRAHEAKTMVPTRALILRTLCSYAKHLNRTEYRDKIVITIKDEFGRDRSFLYRIAFLKFCGFALGEFSLKYLRKNLAHDVMTLCDDFVVNVRHRAILVLQGFVRLARQLGDNAYADELKQFVKTRLGSEKDRDVLFQLQQCDALFTSLSIVGTAIKADTERSQYENMLVQQELDLDEAKKRREMEDARHEVSQRIAKSEKAAAKAAMVGRKPNQSTTAAMAIANKAVESNKTAKATPSSPSSSSSSSPSSTTNATTAITTSVSALSGTSSSANSMTTSAATAGAMSGRKATVTSVSILSATSDSSASFTSSPSSSASPSSFASSAAGNGTSSTSSSTTAGSIAKKATIDVTKKAGGSLLRPSTSVAASADTLQSKKYVTSSTVSSAASSLGAGKGSTSSVSSMHSFATAMSGSSSIAGSKAGSSASLVSSSASSASVGADKSLPRYMHPTTSSHRSVAVPSASTSHSTKSR